MQKQDGMLAALHSVRGKAAVPRAAKYEHRSPVVHRINRADTRLDIADLILSLDVLLCILQLFIRSKSNYYGTINISCVLI